MNYAIYNSSQIKEIKQLFQQTFSDSEGETEGKVIGDLACNLMQQTKAKDLFVFVATEKEKIVASIIFSRLTFEDNTNAFLLAPVAVHTKYHGKGVGQALINFGLNILREQGVTLAFTYGDIRFYSKVGFSIINESIIKAPLPLSYPEGWLGQSLTGGEVQVIAGLTRCVKALNHKVYW